MDRAERLLPLAILLALVAIGVWIAWPFHGAIALAPVLALALFPLQRWLAARVGRRGVAAGIVVALVALALVVPLALVGVRLAREAADIAGLVQDPSGFEATAVRLLGDLGVPADAARSALETLRTEGGAYLRGAVVGVASHLVLLGASILVFFVLLFYLLVDGERLVAWLRETLPLAPHRTDAFLAEARDRTNAILLGTFVVGLLQGVLSSLGWWVAGLPAPVFWGFVMTLLAILPFVGPSLVLIPAGILLVAQGDWLRGVGIVVWGVVLVSLVDNIARPYIIGRRARIHPALVLVGTLGGLAVLGASGFVLGPLVLGLIPVAARLWSEARRAPYA